MCEAFRKLFVGPLMVTLRKISSFSLGERSPRAVLSAFDLDPDTLMLRFDPAFFAFDTSSAGSAAAVGDSEAVSASFGGIHSSGKGGSTAAGNSAGCFGDMVE